MYYPETYLFIFYHVKKQTNESQTPVSLRRAYNWSPETSHYQKGEIFFPAAHRCLITYSLHLKCNPPPKKKVLDPNETNRLWRINNMLLELCEGYVPYYIWPKRTKINQPENIKKNFTDIRSVVSVMTRAEVCSLPFHFTQCKQIKYKNIN
jgi:hypothetical protein